MQWIVEGTSSFLQMRLWRRCHCVLGELGSLGHCFPSCSRGWMQFVNHAGLGHGLLSVHRVIFLGVAVKMPWGSAWTCWKASRREEQQGRAGQLTPCLLKVQINTMDVFNPDFLGILQKKMVWLLPFKQQWRAEHKERKYKVLNESNYSCPLI